MHVNFEPEIGQYFSTKCTRSYMREAGSFGGTATTYKSIDRSYNETIFRMAGGDRRMLLGDPVAGEIYSAKRVILLRSDYEIHAIGPEVIAALGLNEEPAP
jgi:hypothetical protein